MIFLQGMREGMSGIYPAGSPANDRTIRAMMKVDQ
jgi:hypothetical protein